MIGLIPLDVYNLEVAVFDNDAERVQVLQSEGCDAEPYDDAALASAHLDNTPDGYPRLSFVIKPEAGLGTVAHECSHIADFVCHALSLPISLEATEVRAYLVGYLFDCLQKMLVESGG